MSQMTPQQMPALSDEGKAFRREQIFPAGKSEQVFWLGVRETLSGSPIAIALILFTVIPIVPFAPMLGAIFTVGIALRNKHADMKVKHKADEATEIEIETFGPVGARYYGPDTILKVKRFFRQSVFVITFQSVFNIPRILHFIFIGLWKGLWSIVQLFWNPGDLPTVIGLYAEFLVPNTGSIAVEKLLIDFYHLNVSADLFWKFFVVDCFCIVFSMRAIAQGHTRETLPPGVLTQSEQNQQSQ